MIDFPIDELLDDSICTLWLERHLHSDGLTCPHCGRSERRLFRIQGHFPAYRCRACEGYDTLLTGTVFAKTRQRTGNREYGTLAQRYVREFDAKWLRGSS
jgi:transposase-like protein